MATLPYFYSMVVDSRPLHPYQAHILLFTLERFGAVPRERILVQCTEQVPAVVRQTLVRQGYTVTNIAPYLDEASCNKIVQLDYFMTALPSAERTEGKGVFLLDPDLAILSPLDVPDRKIVWGKIVGGANPPLSTLERIFSAADVEPPGIIPCDVRERQETFTTNFHGGFLYVPLAFVARLRTSWRRWAEFLFGRPELFDDPDHRKHLDQIAFALTMVSERIPYAHLTANWNFPCHAKQRPRTYAPRAPLHVLHYHGGLDPYGLLAPRCSEPAVHAAAERVNAALGKQNDPTFFDLYKQYRAQQAVAGVPSIGESIIPKDRIPRTRLNSGEPLRLILHVGTPKTGTTGLQRHLDAQREALAQRGIWYPPPTPKHEYGDPKHQRFVEMLAAANEAGFVEYVQEALRDMPESAHTVIISTEGMYGRWWDYTPRMLGMLRYLANLFDFEMCVWFREPASFAASLYLQFLRNANLRKDPKDLMGRDLDFDEVLQNSWFRRRLDYLGFYYEAQCLFGRERVTPFVYSGDTVKTFLTHYDIGGDIAVRASPAARRANRSLKTVAGVRLMRFVNRWRGRLPSKQQMRLATLVQGIDFLIGGWSPSFNPNPRQADLVNRYAGRGWSIVQAECQRPLDPT